MLEHVVIVSGYIVGLKMRRDSSLVLLFCTISFSSQSSAGAQKFDENETPSNWHPAAARQRGKTAMNRRRSHHYDNSTLWEQGANKSYYIKRTVNAIVFGVFFLFCFLCREHFNTCKLKVFL